MIEPTVGRMVHFRRDPNPDVPPQAAIVCFVHNVHLVNLGVFNYDGEHLAMTEVPLRQPGEKPPVGCYCEWMPFQVGQSQAVKDTMKEATAERDERAPDLRRETMTAAQPMSAPPPPPDDETTPA